ncbi:phage Gp37/Gp68 family protein [Paraburkholderia sp. BL17N1]|uniref:phage Gp37/Gp68 family protein n=1 Tax=Paraburkholderia sp. BL17N1 TaxID=1938798 RepID=UPI000EACD2B8|nr:phage Gp37/Gp68 family protein [Paraburkholderia sp. BL17N1]RKR46261.1 protein gp37 [Paraburkholderia sp. BL17N1]
MSENSKIEWTDHTFNPWEGCQKVGPGCDHCYAETRNARYGGGVAINWGPGASRRRTSKANWRKPLQWNANHADFFAEHGRRQRVFCASLADVFDNAIDPRWRADLFDLIDATPNLDWLLLTKRIGNVMSMVSETAQYQFDLDCLEKPRLPENVSIGATIVDRDEMLRDAGKLLAVPARVRFWSVEPMLGDLGEIPLELMPEWVICGGESGANARPMHPDWARDLRDQCEAAGVPFLFKQWGEWAPGENCGGPMKRTERVADWFADEWSFSTLTPSAAVGMHYDDEPTVYRVGKKTAGRHLDGRTHDEFPRGAE